MLKHCAASALQALLLLAVAALLPALAGSASAAAAAASAQSPPATTPAETPRAVIPAAPDAVEPSDDATPDTGQDVAGDAENAAEVDRLLSREFRVCMDAAAGITVPMQDCMNAEVERLEKHMAEQRARIAPALSEERAKALNDALEAWENLRKNGSAAMYDPDGGTLATVISSLWYLEQTARMSRWLDDMLSATSQ